MEKWEIRPPLPQKSMNRSPPKVARVITSGTPTPIQNFITIQLLPFAPPPNMLICASSDSASFFGSSFRLQPRPLHRFSRSIRHMTRFRARMYLLGVPKTKFYISTPFPPNAIFLPIFDGTKFRVKKALTIGMLTCKLLFN